MFLKGAKLFAPFFVISIIKSLCFHNSAFPIEHFALFPYLCPMEIVVTYENPNSEDSIQIIVAEPVGEYRPTEKPPYAGTSINKAIKDYYACPKKSPFCNG